MAVRVAAVALYGWLAVVVTAIIARIALVDGPIAGPEFAAWLLLGSAPATLALVSAGRFPAGAIAKIVEDVEAAAEAKPHCPYCRSADVAVEAKASSSSYQRCRACGQVWHPDRLRGTRAVQGNRW